MNNAEFEARREAALLRFEAATNILHGFINGPVGGTVMTESGAIPTLITLKENSEQLAGAINDVMREVTTQLTVLPE